MVPGEKFSERTAEAQKISETYDKIAPKYESILGYSYMFLKDEIDAYFNSLPHGSTLLDAGCGPGFEAVVAARTGLSVTGFDISNEMLNRFRDRLPQATAVQGSLTDMSFADQRFDSIFTSCALLHLDRESGEKAIQELSRVLKTGGRGFIGTSISKNEIDLHSRPAFEEVGVDHLYFYHWSADDFVMNLEKAGFKILSAGSKPIVENRPTYTHYTVLKI